MKDDPKDQRSGEGSASALERLKTLQKQTERTRALPVQSPVDHPKTGAAGEAALLDAPGSPDDASKPAPT